ncbi:uncharacterized protein F4822DRAFT_411246 [Hypoxylon trugodes]|uniref:uncharacterized protein n=1 Tax=Hypoxylon trugodes TaxID=326681 RepID=UPI00219B7917|nr:uncharacterized protein F4822DRAFT_411246 [Hypoxylon trugodes]KAI1386794.1 hypothetical protein F4822DRAFT_411246 [Hypoxylon trugodes]
MYQTQLDPMDRSSSLSSLDSLIIIEPSTPQKKQKFYKRIFQIIWTEWNRARREAWLDLRSIRWKRVGRWTVPTSWTLATLGLFSFLTIYGTLSQSFEPTNSACRSDNSFNCNISTYDVWTASGFFEVDIGFGDLTFTQAKVIDVSWDMVIGRGGQTLMAFISWRAFADYVTTSMEFAPITYTMFFVVFLQDEPSILSTFRVARIFLSGRKLKSKVAMIFMISSMLFLLGFPTFAGAITGYTTIVEAFVPDYDGRYIPFSGFQPIAYVINDGWRVNLTANEYVSFFGSETEAEPVYYMGFFYHACSILGGDAGCSLQETVSNYVATYGLLGLQNTTSTWENVTLPSPILNISAFYIPPATRGTFNGADWSDPRNRKQEQPFDDPSKTTFIYNNKTYPLSYVQSNGRCQTVQDRFKWGFSYIQSYILVILLSIWTIGIWMMWLKARRQLPPKDQVQIPKGWRAILVLAERMNEELQNANIDINFLTDQQLKEEIQKQLHGGSVSFNITTSRNYSFRRGLWLWLKREWKWCLILVLTMILAGTFIYWPYSNNGFLFSLGFVPPLPWGVMFAMVLGNTTRSKAFMTGCWWTSGLAAGLTLRILT